MKNSRGQSAGSEFLSEIVRHIVYPIWLRRDHPYYSGYFAEFEQSQYLRPEEIRAIQLRRLRSLLEHSYASCKFYRDSFDRAGVKPSAVACLEDIKLLPVLTKRQMQDHGPLMLAANVPATARVRNQTGGSTGSPLQFYVDKERFDSRRASTDRHNLWVGLRPGDWYAHLWGARLDQIIHHGVRDWLRNTFLYRRIELNTSCITEDHWREFIARVRRKQPRYLIAYARSAVLFANYLRENRITDVRFDSIITTAEVLFPEERRLLEEVLNGRVFNRYGCREVSVIASECEHHRLHVNAETLLIEIDRDGSHGTAGKVLVTDLLNRSMPLIRYEIGDIAEWADEQDCPCGRGLPILANVQGRTTDFLELSDGRRISGPALTLVVADMPDVRQVQFVQHGPSRIELRVVPGSGYGEHTRSELRRRLFLYIGEGADLDLTETTAIGSEASGKYRFVISHLSKGVPQGASRETD